MPKKKRVPKEYGYTYYIGKDGFVWRKPTVHGRIPAVVKWDAA